MTMDRRQFMTGVAGAAVGGLLLGGQGVKTAFAQSMPTYTPEPGAALRILRWVPFVPQEDEAFTNIVTRFTQATGIEVIVDKEGWEDIRPKAAVAANVGAGPDIVMSWFDAPHLYPDKLLDLTELGTAIGGRDGGFYKGMEGYAKYGDKWIDIPVCCIGNAVNYRQSWIEKAGFSSYPTDSAGFLELCKALQGAGLPAGFPFGKAVGDGSNLTHWLLWSHGGKMVDENGAITINSPETMDAIRYAMELYKTFIPGTESWGDVNNNRAYIAEQISLTANGISMYFAAKNDPATAHVAEDTRTHIMPIGPIGEAIELHQVSTMSVFSHTKYPEAALAFLKFFYERENMGDWVGGGLGYCCHALPFYEANPIWTSAPVLEPYSKASSTLRPNGYAGPLGAASASVMADYVLIDMFAEAVTGQRTPEEAMRNAQRRAERYYRS